MSDGPRKRRLREKAHIPLRALAREMGISAPYLLDLERGFRAFSDQMLARHSAALERLTAAKKNPALG